MKNAPFAISAVLLSVLTLAVSCGNKQTKNDDQDQNKASAMDSTNRAYGGYENAQKYGEHLVLIAGCHDCHTPKKVTPQGLDLNMALMLSGHPSGMPDPPANRKEVESKGMMVTQDLTAWVGPWGVSYAANLTPDATGIGNWEEGNFITALRKGKHKGIDTERGILPPMPWQMFRNMSDNEIKSIFAYLKSIKPIKNTVPQPLPPVTAKAHPDT